MSQILRCWFDDYTAVEKFCETHGFGFGDIIENGEKHSVLFLDMDGDDVECCLSMNDDDTHKNDDDNTNLNVVKMENIVFRIPLNAHDLKTNVCEKLLKYCIKHGIIVKRISEKYLTIPPPPPPLEENKN